MCGTVSTIKKTPGLRPIDFSEEKNKKREKRGKNDPIKSKKNRHKNT